jgi:hypothetical protein
MGSKQVYAHHTSDKEGASTTLIMLEPVWLVMVSSEGMHAMESLGIDGQTGQYPVTLMVQLPVCT